MSASEATASRAAPGGAAAAHGTTVIVGFSAALGAVMPLATDTYLIVMPAIARDLGGTLAATQRTMAVFSIGFGLAHLLVGAAADRWGRRPVAIASMLLFFAASVAVIRAPSLEALTLYRFLQGAFCAAGPILSRAIVRDAIEPAGLAPAYSATNMLIGIGPLVAPFIGAYMSAWGGWRAALAVLVVYSVVLSLALIARLPETRPARTAIHHATISPFAAASQILANRSFVLGGAAALLIYSMLFTWLTTSPFLIVNRLGIPTTSAAAIYGTGAACYILTNLVVLRMARSWAPVKLMLAGAVTMLAGALIASWALAVPGIGAASLTFAMLPFYIGLGLAHPNTLQVVMRPFSHVAGQASAWLGLLQQLGGVGVSLVAVALGAGLAAVWVMVSCGTALVAVSAVLARSEH